MTIGRLWIVLSVVALVASAGAAQADTMRIGTSGTYGPWQAGAGGEFTVTEWNGRSYATVSGEVLFGLSGIDGLFQTFCIEKNEYVYKNELTHVELSGEARMGGKGGGNPDPLDMRTSYLYSNFWHGSLSDYDYFDNLVDDGKGRKDSAAALQQAIWFLENEIVSVSGQAADWVQEAEAAVLGGTWTAALHAKVQVINNWDAYDAQTNTFKGVRQDQLIVVAPLPAAGLLGFALLGGLGVLSGARRRRTRQV